MIRSNVSASMSIGAGRRTRLKAECVAIFLATDKNPCSFASRQSMPTIDLNPLGRASSNQP